MKKHISSKVFIVFSLAAFSQSNIQPLSDACSFALDPLKIRADEGWAVPAFPDNKPDKVTVPDSFLLINDISFIQEQPGILKKIDARPIGSGF